MRNRRQVGLHLLGSDLMSVVPSHPMISSSRGGFKSVYVWRCRAAAGFSSLQT